MGSSSLLLPSPLPFLRHHRASLRPSSLPLRPLHLRARSRGASLDPQPLPKPVSSSAINVYEEQDEVDEDEDEARGYTEDDDDDDEDDDDDDDYDEEEEEGRGYVGEEEDGGRGYVGEEEEGEDDTDEEEDGENKGEGGKISKRKGRRMRRRARKQAWREAEWMDCEDRILEDTVPLVGFIRMILHSGKGECHSILLNIRDIYQSGQRLSPEHEKAIIERLLVHHPNYKGKIGCGIDYLTIGYHPDFHTSRCLFIVRKDGEFVDISFWKCLKNFIRTKYPLYADSFILRHFQRRKRYD